MTAAIKLVPSLVASTDAELDTVLVEGLLSKKIPIGIVGLGYVGLPLACHLAKSFKVRGFDIHQSRVDG